MEGRETATVYYLQTSDPEQVVRVRTDRPVGSIRVVFTPAGMGEFNLVSPLTAAAMRQAARAAKGQWLALVNPDRVATRPE